MLDFFNAVFLAATLLSNIVLYSDQDYPFPDERESVVAVSLHREFWREDGNGKCKYTGVMVPYVRDWEEVVKNGEIETVLPPEPNKTAGHAFIVNRKVCGSTVEPVFRTGAIFGTSGRFQYKNSVTAFDVTEMREDQRPKWLAQVLQRVERAAAHDDKAKDFIQFNKTASFAKLPADVDTLLKSQGGVPSTSSNVPAQPAAKAEAL